MSYDYSENILVQESAGHLLHDELGWEVVFAYNTEKLGENGTFGRKNYKEILLARYFREALLRLNPWLTLAQADEAQRKLENRLSTASLLQINEEKYFLIRDGIPVTVKKPNGKTEEKKAAVVDFRNPDNNHFLAIKELKIHGDLYRRRTDIVGFVNGIPLLFIELKKNTVDVQDAYTNNYTDYLDTIPHLFYYNAFLILSNGTEAKVGTLGSKYEFFHEWKRLSEQEQGSVALETVLRGICKKENFLDLLENFILFDHSGGHTAKILARNHQYLGVNEAVKAYEARKLNNGKLGVFWHTQGSGKSLSMVFYAHLLQSALNSPTIVVITDRNDLDDQLYTQFAKCKDFLRQESVHATSRAHLKQLLEGIKANGIFFTTMQKFEESAEPLSERRNIIVMADEAHRGQYGLSEKIDKDGNIRVGTARIIRNSLPNATYIGFTGTPLSLDDRNTREVFGDYIDVYDMTQAVEDGATRPVYYESRVIKLHLKPEILQLIDAEYDLMAQNAEPEVIEKSKKQLGQMETILSDDDTINSLVCDILDHYENYRENLLTGKAMIVAYSRPIALKIYHRLLELRPNWQDKIAVVMTSSNNDPEDWRKIIGNKSHKEELARKFKDNNDPLKIAIVVDMWLTGFDVPSLATMYVYKPMEGHNLMQAIARVNRVFEDKEGGLVVDYIGIASALKKAMNDYTIRDRKNYGNMDIASTAYNKFREKLQVCRDLLHGFDYSEFATGSNLVRARLISGATNFIIAREKNKEKDAFIKQALMLHQALSLCASIVEENLRIEAAFLEAVRIMILRLTESGGGKKISLPEMNKRINELLEQSIKSDGVINLFSDIKEEFSLFDPKFLEEISKMKEKNLAVELLKKLIAEQISIYRHTNVVRSEKFSEMIQESMNRYLNGMLTNEQVIEELLNLAKQIASAQKEGEDLGLNVEEAAFYDALTRPQAVKDFYENDELIAITKELTETLRKNKTIDWQKKETARAKMRMLIKRLLKKHKYPPEGVEDAVQTVMTQCELWTDNIMEA